MLYRGPTPIYEKSFVVKYIFPKSPASVELKLNDEIIGVNGTAFTTKHIFGKAYGIASTPGIEGPIMDFGNAIEDSEGAKGLLTLKVIRAGKEKTVEIRLEPIGRFSNTFPFKCRKSDKLVSDALKYLTKQKNPFMEGCQTKATVGLAFLSQNRMTEVRKLVKVWNKAPGEGTWTWPVSYQCIFLCEYYQKTKDRQVLKTIEQLVEILYTAQVQNIYDYKNRMHSGQPQAKNFLTGGLGHIVKIDGYGTMTITTLLAMLSWELAEDCGIKLKRQYVEKAYKCVKDNTHETGYMGYRFGGGAYSPVGCQGLAIITHKLAKRTEANAYIKTVTYGLVNAKNRVNDGHGDNVLSMFWALLGIQVSGDKEAIRQVLDYNKAFINMARTHDGSFVAQPCRNTGDKGYYLSSRLHPTAAMILILSMDQPRLKIQRGK